MKGRTDAQCLDNGHVAVLKSEGFRESLDVQSEGSATDVEALNRKAIEMGPGEIVSFFSQMDERYITQEWWIAHDD